MSASTPNNSCYNNGKVYHSTVNFLLSGLMVRRTWINNKETWIIQNILFYALTEVHKLLDFTFLLNWRLFCKIVFKCCLDSSSRQYDFHSHPLHPFVLWQHWHCLSVAFTLSTSMPTGTSVPSHHWYWLWNTKKEYCLIMSSVDPPKTNQPNPPLSWAVRNGKMSKALLMHECVYVKNKKFWEELICLLPLHTQFIWSPWT
jgi:hypothetical protein